MRTLKKNSFSAFFMGVVFVTFTSCGGGGGGAGGGGSPQEEESREDGTVSYAQLSQSILQPKCFRCHVEFRQETGVRQQVVPGNPQESALFQMVENGTMPLGGPPLSTRELEIVRSYIEGISLIDNRNVFENSMFDSKTGKPFRDKSI